jgi:hypothetical protein
MSRSRLMFTGHKVRELSLLLSTRLVFGAAPTSASGCDMRTGRTARESEPQGGQVFVRCGEDDRRYHRPGGAG